MSSSSSTPSADLPVTQSSSSPSSINTIPTAIPDFEIRQRYGRKDIQVLASNNPACLLPTAAHSEYQRAPMKAVLPLGSATATQLHNPYEESIHPAIMRILKEEVKDHKNIRALHVVRMGWDSGGPHKANYPIVLLFIFEDGGVSADVAERILSAVASEVHQAWQGEEKEK